MKIILAIIVTTVCMYFMLKFADSRNVQTCASISKEQYKEIITDAWHRGKFAKRREIFGYDLQKSFENDTSYMLSQFDSLIINKKYKALY